MTTNTPNSLPAPIDVLREMDRFDAAMRRAFDYTPDRNPFSEVVPHAEEAYQFSRDNDRFMGFCMAVAAGNGGKAIPAETLLDIARATGLRSYLHGVNATDSREILARYQHAIDAYRESFPADPTHQISKWVYDATRHALDAVHAVVLQFGCPRGAKVTDWLRTQLTASTAERLDADRMRAICAEMDANRRGVSYNGMPIWDAMCDAVGDDRSGDGLRAAIDTARAGDAS